MNDNNLKIALTFSGGGYRAAAFHLGALSYLHAIKMGEKDTLLNHVTVLSTISGGTITGLRYMQGLCCREAFEDIAVICIVSLRKLTLPLRLYAVFRNIKRTVRFP